MPHTDDPVPRPGKTPERRPLEWRLTPTIDLAGHSGLSLNGNVGINAVDRRRSTRQLSPADTSDVAFIVRETFRNTSIGTGEREGRRRKRPVSAGAIHPVKCLFLRDGGEITLYDDENDAFALVSPIDPSAVSAFIEHCREVLPAADGHWVVFIVDQRDPERLYENHVSLLWRDAGAALQTMALIATLAGLGFCPMGLLGQKLADALLPDDHTAVAVGVAAIGRLAP